MQTTRDDGGSAFPQHGWTNDPETLARMRSAGIGMTLHEYFAAKFAAAWVIALASRYGEPGWSDEAAAIEANRLGIIQADAMLAARKTREAMEDM